jgi:hypothetical protein
VATNAADMKTHPKHRKQMTAKEPINILSHRAIVVKKET